MQATPIAPCSDPAGLEEIAKSYSNKEQEPGQAEVWDHGERGEANNLWTPNASESRALVA